MHGVVKVKNPQDSEQAKKKEKQESYVKKFKEVCELQDLSTSHLAFIGDVLLLSPDNATLWNRRRQIILRFIDSKRNERAAEESMQQYSNENSKPNAILFSLRDDPSLTETSLSEIQSLFESELRFTAVCLSLMPKSYACWYHRRWCFLLMPSPPWNIELDICSEYLSRDERNFHCWCYWAFLTSEMNLSTDLKLAFVTKKVIDNFSNYSAWHYRSRILGPKLDAATLESEHDLLQNAVFTDPNDQSPWFYHQWLLSCDVPVHILFVDLSKCHIDLWASRNILSKRIKVIDTQNSVEIEIVWTAFDGPNPYACTGWHGIFKSQVAGLKVRIALDSDLSSGFELHVPEDPECSVQASIDEIKLYAPKSRSVLLNELDKLKSLHALEPKSKWCSVAMATLMRILDVSKYKTEILSIYESLCELDSQRKGYYSDLRSKLIYEHLILTNFPLPKTVDLSGEGLTALYLTQYFHNIEELNISDNKIRSLNGIHNLRYLKTLYARNNCIHEITDLKFCPYLIYADIRFNPVCKDNELLTKFMTTNQKCVLKFE